MLPTTPLRVEHRLIEKLIKLMEKQAIKIRKNKLADIEFIDDCIDFIKTYADWCHHGKEEDILFRGLKDKKLSDEHRKIVNSLIKEHDYARKITSKLVQERNNYMNSANEAEKQIISFEIYGHLKALISFYPEHIRKEDKEFFQPCMEYFTARQKKEMLQQFQEFDRELIHKKYQELVKEKQKVIREQED
jgi:hemerythrin-like domain-containing protein